MNAEEFAQKIAALMAERDARHAAAVAELRAHIAELKSKVEGIPPARDGRDGLPGVPGPRGEKGEPGRDGKDGILTVEEIAGAIEFDGERTFKIFGRQFRVPAMIHRGVFNHGAQYDAQDVVTYGGSEWLCRNAGTQRRPGDGSADWLLIVKAGRDGRDYKGERNGQAQTLHQ